MNKDTIRQIVNVVAIAATILLNILANALPFNNQNTGDISDSFPVLFTPAGYVFAIWGLIYIGLIAFAIFQALPSQRENPRLRAVGYVFALGCLANIAWLFGWHYLNQSSWFFFTEIAMLLLLVSLIMTYLRLGIGRTTLSTLEYWTVSVPISIYLGWISVATIANTSILLYSWGLSSLSADVQAWLTVMMLTIGAVLAILMAFLRRDVAFILVLSWAYLGVAVPAGQDHPLVSGVAYLLAAVLAILAIVTVFWKRK
jgi:translocator protein